MEAVLERALRDASALEDAGLDGVLVENFGDVPFHGGAVPPETVAALARVTAAVVEAVDVPVGVNVLRNDARAALGVAVAAGARFIRVNVHTGIMWTDQGAVEGAAAETLRTRAALGHPVAILADVLVKHATPPPGLEAAADARDAWHRGLADGLLVTGAATGHPTDDALLAQVREAVPDAPVWVASGVTVETVRATLEQADGAIVGTDLTRGGAAGSGVDPQRAKALVEAARASSPDAPSPPPPGG